jgi:adenylate kinase
VAVRLIIFGRQGAGKGTQAKMLSAHYGAPHISTGDMLREAVAEGTAFGRKAKEYLDSGELLPDDIMMGIVDDRMHKADALEKGYLLDGFPRTLVQAEALIAASPIDVAIHLEVPEALVLQRLSERRVCAQCGHIYQAGQQAAITGICEICGGEVVQRDDDRPEAIAARLEAYAEKTMPTVKWFDQHGLLTTVDGVGTTDEVRARLIGAIDVRTK